MTVKLTARYRGGALITIDHRAAGRGAAVHDVGAAVLEGFPDPPDGVRGRYHDGVLSDGPAADREAVAGLVRAFFAAFTSGPGSAERLTALRALFLPGAVIVRTCGLEPAVLSVDAFIAPRQALLSGGALTDFREWELRGHTEIFGDIAHHFTGYAKAGVQDGTPFTARGMKSLQFVRTAAGWRISAAAWDDERPGLSVPPD